MNNNWSLPKKISIKVDMPIYGENRFTEQRGIDFVRAAAREARSIFRSIGSKDTGIDAIIELLDAYNATGDLIALQIKSGQSYWRKGNKGCKVPIKRGWLNYWQNYSLPVVLIVHDAARNRACWLDVQRYLLHHPLAKNKRSLIFPATNWFTFRTITEEFPILVNRLDKPGKPKVPSWAISRAEAALKDIVSIAESLLRLSCTVTYDVIREAFDKVNLRFDGEITCIDTEGQCIVHSDERLIGCNLGKYRDLYGQYVFRNLVEQPLGYLTWIDDFDADAFSPHGRLENYKKASTNEPTRVNFAAYSFFEPWRCYIIVESHHKITP